MNLELQQGAEAYAELHRAVLQDCGGYLAAEADSPTKRKLGELEVQSLWMAGLLGNEGVTLRHGAVRIIDFGEWNRSVGPDFRRAEIEIDGVRMRGDIELDPTAQDWEHHGHGSNPEYNKVVLHVVLSPPPEGWYTRDSQHRDIPILTISEQTLLTATVASPPLPAEKLELCREPLAAMGAEEITHMLQAAAAYRILNKRKAFRKKATNLGLRQAWYEALAETLGYHANKLAMQMLARRAPIRELGIHAESILFGTAGFLVPVLPEQATPETRSYHRSVWDAWWPQRSQYELETSRAINWHFAPVRPGNHPHRRVAALATAVAQWKSIEPLLNAVRARELTKKLTSLEHPYWSHHCTLPSAPLRSKMALIGASRARDFLINHVYVQDESPACWHTYLSIKDSNIPSAVQRTAHHLFGDREDMQDLLNHAYAQQALLQIDADFCAVSPCKECLFPAQLCRGIKAPCQG